MERLKIDVVDELHEIRRKHARASSREIEKLSSDMVDEVKELAALAREVAPEHGRSTYGEPSAGLVPSDIYGEDHASNALEKGKKARKIAEKLGADVVRHEGESWLKCGGSGFLFRRMRVF